MSTAGKVLAVVVMLMSLIWMILSAGVSQLNANGHKRLHELAGQIATLQEDLEHTQDEVVELKSSTSFIQEKLDHDVMALRARQSDVEKDRSQVRETLSRWQYQVTIVQETIDRAKSALQHRIEEHDTGQQRLAKTRSEVDGLMHRSDELMNRLIALRKEFTTTYRTNVESLGKTR